MRRFLPKGSKLHTRTEKTPQNAKQRIKMTREEEIKSTALEEYKHIIDTEEGSVAHYAFIKGARWADAHPQNYKDMDIKPTKVDAFNQLTFDVNFPQFIKEAAENCNGGMYAICWNIFRSIIADVAQRATELRDPVLDALMIKLNLYEMPNEERRPTIGRLQKIYYEMLNE